MHLNRIKDMLVVWRLQYRQVNFIDLRSVVMERTAMDMTRWMHWVFHNHQQALCCLDFPFLYQPVSDLLDGKQQHGELEVKQGACAPRVELWRKEAVLELAVGPLHGCPCPVSYLLRLVHLRLRAIPVVRVGRK